MSRAPAAVIGLMVLAAPAAALQDRLDRRAIEEAMALGASRFDAERRAFHETYRLGTAAPPVDWIDVITPFHRVQLAAEEASATGIRFGQREAFALLGETGPQLDLLVELSFHPLNTFVGVPGYAVVLVDARGGTVEPRRLDRVPRFGPRVGTPAPAYPAPGRARAFGEGQPVLGGTIVAAFDLRLLDPRGRYAVVVADGDEELVRAELDLEGMR